MNKYLLALSAAILMAGCSSTSDLAQDTRVDASERVVITWSNPSNYTDMREANGNSQKFRDSIFKKLHTYMDEMAQSLPPGQKLRMVVTDLDLAGRVLPGNFVGLKSQQEVRLVKATTFPTMTFSFELVDEAGNILLSGEKVIKNMELQQSIGKRVKMPALGHEKYMLQKWYHAEIDKQVALL